MDWQTLKIFSVGDNPGLADEFASLVLSGTNTATRWAAVAQDGTWQADSQLGGNGRRLAVSETVKLTLRRLMR
jgi:hypothetical protein